MQPQTQILTLIPLLKIAINPTLIVNHNPYHKNKSKSNSNPNANSNHEINCTPNDKPNYDINNPK